MIFGALKWAQAHAQILKWLRQQGEGGDWAWCRVTKGNVKPVNSARKRVGG